MNLISNPLLVTALMLAVSNLFMTFAWYGHLKNLATSPWYVAALVSWGIALFEYMFQVPANRIGYTAAQPRAVEDSAGGHHAVGVRAVRGAVHEPAVEDGLSVCGAVPDGCGVFYFQGVTVIPAQPESSRTMQRTDHRIF